MLLTYNLSLRGRDHYKSGTPCQDYSASGSISNSWKYIVTADGVGSCKNSDIASQIAVEVFVELLKMQFPRGEADDRNIKSLLLTCANGAANAIEEYIEINDPDNFKHYQTTLVAALVSNNAIYYVNIGDSGLIALDEDGNYHILTTQQNGSEGGVFAMPAFHTFAVGKADFAPVAAVCMTDGIFDKVVPDYYQDQKYQVIVPFLNVFTTFLLGIDESKADEVLEKGKAAVKEFLNKDKNCENWTDDLSVAVCVESGSFLMPSDIPWEEPEIDFIEQKWKKLNSLYSDPKINCEEMIDYLHYYYAYLSDDEVNKLVKSLLNGSYKNTHLKPRLADEGDPRESDESKEPVRPNETAEAAESPEAPEAAEAPENAEEAETAPEEVKMPEKQEEAPEMPAATTEPKMTEKPAVQKRPEAPAEVTETVKKSSDLFNRIRKRIDKENGQK